MLVEFDQLFGRTCHMPNRWVLGAGCARRYTNHCMVDARQSAGVKRTERKLVRALFKPYIAYFAFRVRKSRDSTGRYAFSYYFSLLLLALVLDMLVFLAHPLSPAKYPRGILVCVLITLSGSTFLFIWPLSTGSLPPSRFMSRMSIVQPSCWLGDCFNAPAGSPLRTARELVGGEQKLLSFMANGSFGF